ncbi:hypothetical protein FEM48_Zijuj02G0154100 [Ziziphus jujuba var. spinosa]|uniref:Pentatricopeptide repeat-containing protein n=1 Tax=Ziziphus jujuba var. spinosa TaxID=714518 RepID=A0A978VWG9_ZIZJJ|nr:hypothetical protein FEM48_Zijuj02G0154100 [Ziziphus jujuba var. spinosa]
MGSIGRCYREFDGSNSLFFETLIDSYRKMGLLVEAIDVFLGLKDFEFVPTLLFCNLLLRDLLKTNRMELFWKVFDRMSEMEMNFDVYTYSNLISAHLKTGNVDEAQRFLLEMGEKNCHPNVVTYNLVINGLCRARRVDEAVEIKRSMIEEGLVPDNYTYATLVNGYCMEKRLTDAELVFSEMIDAGMKPDVVAYSSLIDGLIKQGNLDEAFRIKNKMMNHGIEIGLIVHNTHRTRQARLYHREEPTQPNANLVVDALSGKPASSINTFERVSTKSNNTLA